MVGLSLIAAIATAAYLVIRLYHPKKQNQRMSARLVEIDQMKKNFISHVSHELKAPLASMQETTHLILERIPGPLTDKQQRLLELNLQSGKRLAQRLEIFWICRGSRPALSTTRCRPATWRT